MSSQNKSWDLVGKRIDTLRSHVGTRIDALGASAAADRAALEQSIQAMITALEDGLSAAGDAVRDARLRRDLANLADALRQALLTTVEATGTQLRKKLPRVTPGHVSIRPVASTTNGKAVAKPTITKPAARKSPSKASPKKSVARKRTTSS